MKKMIIDNAHSEIGFTVKHLMISKVKGNFQTFNVGINENGEIEVSINVSSISTGNTDRDNHLKSEDFFDAEQYPTITFKSKSFNSENGTIVGELTIKDVTKEVILSSDYNGTSTDPWGNVKHGFEITGSINRNEFGLTWNAPLETGGVLVSDKVSLNIDVQMTEVVEQMETQSAE